MFGFNLPSFNLFSVSPSRAFIVGFVGGFLCAGALLLW